MANDIKRIWALRISTFAGITFSLLAVAVITGRTVGFDNSVRSAIHASAGPYMTLVATGVSFLGSLLVLIPATAATAAYLTLKGRRLAGLAQVVVMGGALALNWLLKTAIHRPRPQPFFGVDPESLSFPSGHVFFAFCFSGTLVLILCCPRPRATLVAWAMFVLAIAWSRVYLGVHYPTDVVAGLLAGICWLGALYSLGLFQTGKILR